MLSVAIITHNEENNIEEALKSVQWADEIVVLDSSSTDSTREICRKYTSKVHSSEWLGFSEQKNKAVSLTSQPWVLVLDADERVPEDLRNEIISLFRGSSLKDGYYVQRKNYFGKKWIRHGGWWPDYTLRLFRREKGVFERREVHESVKVNGTTGHLKNPLIHYTYKDIDDYVMRMRTYSTLAAKEMLRQGRRAGFLDVIFRPLATFFRMLCLRMGILDGIYGILLAWLYSVYTYKKYSKLMKMQKISSGKKDF
jgi:glycosyltransferase involved in cell wall biosynthesis